MVTDRGIFAVLHNINGPNILASNTVNIAPGEGQILFFLQQNQTVKHLHFQKSIQQEKIIIIKKETSKEPLLNV